MYQVARVYVMQLEGFWFPSGMTPLVLVEKRLVITARLPVVKASLERPPFLLCVRSKRKDIYSLSRQYCSDRVTGVDDQPWFRSRSSV